MTRSDPPQPRDDGEPSPVSPFASQSPAGDPEYSWNAARPRRGLAGKFLLLALLIGLFAIPFTGAGRRLKKGAIEVIEAAKRPRVVKEKEIVEREKEKIVYRDPPPAPLPDKFVPARQVDVAEMWNGIQIQSEVQTRPGDLASKERRQPESFVVKFSVDLRVPKPNATLADLTSLNADLPKALPGLAGMLEQARVSGFYHHLYELKQKAVQQSLTRLDKLLTRHNFFDCETVLEMRHPQSGQRVLLVQGEMDVVADGSDGDRMADFDDYIAKSDHFQPTTTYAWAKQSAAPNPLVARYESRIAELKKKLDAASTAQRKSVQDDIAHYRRVIGDLKARSFLIAQEDPFVVIPLSMRKYVGFNEFTPEMGDYVVVMHGTRLLPAIIGDFGPAHITGEASLRIAKEINGRATPYARPESDLKVSYFIFPGTAEKPFGPPDYAKWHQRCAELLTRIGGVGEGFQLHQWEDRIKKRREAEEAARAAAARAEAEKSAASGQPGDADASAAGSSPAGDSRADGPPKTGPPGAAPPPAAQAAEKPREPSGRN